MPATSTSCIAVRAMQYRRVTGMADGSLVRTAKYLGRDHHVVPVVCMVGNSVVWSISAEGPELVPSETLQNSPPDSWNGRPVVTDHPNQGTTTANTPQYLEANSFGLLFNTRFTKGSLVSEAWLDPERVTAVGELATSVLSRCLAGESVEVSIGAFVLIEVVEGDYNGQHYTGIWRDLVSDHLAMLPVDHVGACSVDMGCGAPRLLAVRSNYNLPRSLGDGRTGYRKDGKGGQRMNAFQRAMLGLSKVFSNRDAEDLGQSSRELHHAIDHALWGVEPAYNGIDAVYPETGYVVYMTVPDGQYLYWRRSYKVDSSGAVTLGDDRVAVEIAIEYKVTGSAELGIATATATITPSPVVQSSPATTGGVAAVVTTATAAAISPSPSSSPAPSPVVVPAPSSPVLVLASRTACACETGTATEPTTEHVTTANAQAQGDPLMTDPNPNPAIAAATPSSAAVATPTTLASAIIGCSRNPYVESDRPTLEGMGAERLTALSTSLNVGSAIATPGSSMVDPVGARAAPVAVSAADEMARWMESAPAPIRDIVTRNLAEERARRDNMVARLSSMQMVYTAEVLTAKPTDELVALLSLLESATATAHPTAHPSSLLATTVAPSQQHDFSGLGIGPLVPANKAPEVPKPYTIAMNKGKAEVAKTN